MFEIRELFSRGKSATRLVKQVGELWNSVPRFSTLLLRSWDGLYRRYLEHIQPVLLGACTGHRTHCREHLLRARRPISLED
jgi:hypothetical protein